MQEAKTWMDSFPKNRKMSNGRKPTLQRWQLHVTWMTTGKTVWDFEMILERSLTYGLCKAGFVSGFYHVYLSSCWSGYSAFHSTSNPSTPNHFTQCRNVRLSQYNNDHRSDQLRWMCSLVYDYQMQYYFWEQAKWQRAHGCRYTGYEPHLYKCRPWRVPRGICWSDKLCRMFVDASRQRTWSAHASALHQQLSCFSCGCKTWIMMGHPVNQRQKGQQQLSEPVTQPCTKPTSAAIYHHVEYCTSQYVQMKI